MSLISLGLDGLSWKSQLDISRSTGRRKLYNMFFIDFVAEFSR